MGRRSTQTRWTPPTLEGAFKVAIGSSVLEEIVGGYALSDVLTELAQNEYDAAGTRLEVSFGSDLLTVTGNGRIIDAAGWVRLSVLVGTGRAVGGDMPDQIIVPKQNSIGSKNFGLRSLFLCGDVIYVCSGGKQMILDLRRLGTRDCEESSSRGQPGVQIYVPYRTEPLGSLESFTIERERQLLSDIVEGVHRALVKLAKPGGRKPLEVIVTSERCGVRIACRQSVVRIRCGQPGLKAIRRKVTIRETRLSGVRKSVRRAFEEIEFQKAFDIPTGYDCLDMPVYFQVSQTQMCLAVSVPVQHGKLKIAEPGVFYYPLGVREAHTGITVSVNGPFQMDSARKELRDTPWNRVLLEQVIELIFELLTDDWRRRFGADAYLALETGRASAPGWFAEAVQRRLLEAECWPIRARPDAAPPEPVLAKAADLAVPEHPDLNRFLSDEHGLDDRIGADPRLRKLVLRCGARRFTVNSLVRLRCAGSSGVRLATKLARDEAQYYYARFPDALRDEDLQVRMAWVLDRQSTRLSPANRRDLRETATTLAADGSLRAAGDLYAVDSAIAAVCPAPPHQQLHPSLTKFPTVTRLCKKFDVSGWARDVAERVIRGTGSEEERKALYQYIRSSAGALSRTAVGVIRRAPVLRDHRDMWVAAQDITLPAVAMARRLEPVLHFPHPEDAENQDLASRLRFRKRVDGRDLVAFARLVSQQPKLADEFERTLHGLRRLLTSTIVQELQDIPFLRSTVRGLGSPSGLYQRTRLTLACLGPEAPFVKGSRVELYRRLRCLDRPRAQDIVAHLGHLRAQERAPRLQEVLYPALVEALEREERGLTRFSGEPILWTGNGYRSPEETLVGPRIPECFVGAVPHVPGPAALCDVYRALGAHAGPGEQHWHRLFLWIGERYRQPGPAADVDRRRLGQVYRLRGGDGLPSGLPPEIRCLLSRDKTLHSLSEVQTGRYVLDDDPPLAEALSAQGAGIAFVDTSAISPDFLSAVDVRSLSEIKGDPEVEIGPERTPPPWFDHSQTLKQLHAPELVSALAAAARDHSQRLHRRTSTAGGPAIVRLLRGVTCVSFVQSIRRTYRVAGVHVSAAAEVWPRGDSILVVWVRSGDELNELLAQALADLIKPDGAADRHTLADRIFRLLSCSSPREMVAYLRRRGVAWQAGKALELEREDPEAQELTIAETLKRQFLDALKLEPEPERPPTTPKPKPPRDQPAPERGPALPAMEQVRLQILESERHLPERRAVRPARRPKSTWTPPGPRDIERDKLVGQRGEELIYEHERKRVRELGYPESRVVWTARDNPGADHDIRSVAKDKDGEDGRDLWIEVKSTTGRDGRFQWEKAEFERALRERDHYELWRVYEAHTLNPKAKRFRDPVRLFAMGAMRLQIASLSIEVEPLTARDQDAESPKAS